MKCVPPLTHLQFAVLDSLLNGESSGQELRSSIAKRGFKKTGPGFYQLMQRLEEGRFVESRIVPVIIGDQTYRERRYKLTGHGERACAQTVQFYMHAQSAQGGLLNA